MKKYIIFCFFIICVLNIKAQNMYYVTAIKGTVTNIAGKKIVTGEKLQLTDKLIFASKTSLLVLVHPEFGRTVVSPGSNKNLTAKNNLFTVLLKDILPPKQVAIKMAENSIPPKPKPQVNKKGDTLQLPAPKAPVGY